MLELKSRHKSFNGFVEFYTHNSISTSTEMTFSVYRPFAEKTEKVSALFFLSGLTCNEENFITKSGAIKYASDHDLMLICPDTSPRGTNIPGEHDDWDFGSSAGFYLNATTDNWKENYKMYDYVSKELPDLIISNFNLDQNKIAISGHSMGGHGALTVGIKNQDLFKSISAFAPICAPMQCPWGVKAFTNYLGEDKESWKEYDASELIKDIKSEKTILIDQGTNDKFLDEQLKPEIFFESAKESESEVKIRMQEGYDHSYYFVSSFIEDHLKFHIDNLN